MNFSKHNHIFGDLEAEIMDVAWKKISVSVRDVLSELSKKRSLAYTTVMTVMSRLADKGVLKRTGTISGAYRYEPILPKEDFLKKASREMVKNLIHEFGDVAVAQFIDVIEKGDQKKRDEWVKKLKKIT